MTDVYQTMANELLTRFEEAVLERFHSMEYRRGGGVTVDTEKDARYQRLRENILTEMVEGNDQR